MLVPRSGFVFGRIPVFDIVDGQHRIATFQIALAALRDLATERKEQSIVDQIRPLLFNLDEASMQDKKIERFRLEPTRLDRQVFRDLDGKVAFGAAGNISVAFHPGWQHQKNRHLCAKTSVSAPLSSLMMRVVSVECGCARCSKRC